MIEVSTTLLKPENIDDCEKIHREKNTHLCFFVYHGDLEGCEEVCKQ